MTHRKIVKKILALICAGTFILGGCSNSNGDGNSEQANGSGNGAKGRYVENSITIEGLTQADGIYVLHDGTYVISNREEQRIETSHDKGATWQSVDEKILYDTIGSNAHISDFCAYGDGTILVFYTDRENEGIGEDGGVVNQYLLMNPDGTIKTGNLITETKSYIPSVTEGSGRIFISDAYGYVYELNTEDYTLTKLFETGNENTTTIYNCGTMLVAINNAAPYFYDLTSNKLLDTDVTLSDFLRENPSIFSMAMTAGDEENTIYIACEKGLYRHTIGGSVMEQVIDSALSSMGDPSKSISGVVRKEDRNFNILYSDGTFCDYVYNPDISSVPEKEVKIYSLYDNQMIRMAMASFQKDNLDIYINYEVGITDNSGMTETDAIKNLNTDMMAGDGPDILLLDGLPMESYIEKGILIDLNDFITEIEGSDSYFEHILSAYEKDNGTYALPVRFNIPILAGSNELTENMNSMSDLENALDKTNIDCDTLLDFYKADEILELFYQTASPELISDDGSLDPNKLSEFLNEAGKINEIENRKITDRMRTDYNDLMEMAYAADGGMPENQRIADVLKANHQVFQTIAGKRAVIAGYLDGTGNDCAFVSEAMEQIQNASIQSLPGLSETGKVFLPVGIVGISSKTDNDEEAKAFIAELLSNNLQQNKYLNGMPVNETAYEKMFDEMDNLHLRSSVFYGNGRDVNLDFTGISEKNRSDIRKIVDNLSVPSVTDNTIHDVIIENGVSVLDGDLSLDEGKNIIMKKVGIYSQE